MEKKFSKKIYGTKQEKILAKPECFGRYLATRIGSRSVVELCSGLGIQLIQIAKVSMKPAIGIDINPKRVEKAIKNAKIYHISNVSFIQGDVTDANLLKSISGEVVIIDPHWSVTRTLQEDFAKNLVDTSPSSVDLVSLSRKYISHNIILQLPSTIPDNQILSLGDCEIQSVYIRNEYKQKIVYYGDLKKTKKSKINFDYYKINMSDKERKQKV